MGYKLTDEEKPWEDWMMNGFNSYGEGPYINKPNATVLKVPEGMIIETGKPFTFEGRKRKKSAEEGIKTLSDCVDTMIVIPNDKLLDIAEKKTTMLEAFAIADGVLSQAPRASPTSSPSPVSSTWTSPTCAPS